MSEQVEGDVGAVGEAVALDVAEDGLGAPPMVKIHSSRVGAARGELVWYGQGDGCFDIFDENRIW